MKPFYDGRKILPGLVLFLGLATSPLWYAGALGAAAARPELVIATEEKQCVESAAYMRASHMTLLESWREQVVREGRTVYTASDRRQHEMSLTGTCLKCHSNKQEFCDRCHDYAMAKPACWDCHTAPKEKK